MVRKRMVVTAQKEIPINFRRVGANKTELEYSILTSDGCRSFLEAPLSSGEARARRLHFNNSSLHNERTFAQT